MNQEYTVLQFKKGDFQDQNGNYWCDMALKGVGEPVRIVVKDPTQFEDGMTLYGHITEETGKTSGKTYQRFRREKRPEGEEAPRTTAPAAKKEWQARDDEGIKAQWALGKAYEKHGYSPATVVEAKWLFSQVEEVKGSTFPSTQKAVEEKQSGYAKFKASKPQPKDQVYNVPDNDEDVRSLVSSGLISQGIPEDELPPGF